MCAIYEVINMVRLGAKFRKMRAYGIIRGRTNKVDPAKKVGSGRYKERRSAFILYWKGGPTFTHKTPQQEKIAAAARKCAEEIRGKNLSWKERKEALRACILREFGKM